MDQLSWIVTSNTTVQNIQETYSTRQHVYFTYNVRGQTNYLCRKVRKVYHEEMKQQKPNSTYLHFNLLRISYYYR